MDTLVSAAFSLFSSAVRQFRSGAFPVLVAGLLLAWQPVVAQGGSDDGQQGSPGSVIVEPVEGNLGVLPVSANPSFVVRVSDVGGPVFEMVMEWRVQFQGKTVGFFGFCEEEYFTDINGEASFDFDREGLSNNVGNYVVTAIAYPGFPAEFCKKGNAQPDVARAIPSRGNFNSFDFVFGIEDLEVVFEDDPGQLPIDQPAVFGLLVRTFPSGVPVEGIELLWDVSDKATNPSSGTTAPTNSAGQTSLTYTPRTLGFGFELFAGSKEFGGSAEVSIDHFQRAIESVTSPPSQTFTDEVGDAFIVRILKDFGSKAFPEGDVEVTFTITSGNALFTANNSTQFVTISNPLDRPGGTPQGPQIGFGEALSSPILVGRTANDVSITVSTAGSTPINVTYVTTPSSYTIEADSPTSVTIDDDQTTELSARLFRAGISTPAPLGAGETVTWSITPPANGATVTPVSLTDAQGVASATFDPVEAGTYEVVAQFNPGITGVSPDTVTFTIDVLPTGPVVTLVPLAGDFTRGAPGFQFPISVRYLEDGQPASPSQTETVIWSVSQGDASVSPPTSLVGQATAIAFTNVTFGSTPGPVIISATLQSNPDVNTFFYLEVLEQIQLEVLEPASRQLDLTPGTPFDIVARLSNLQGLGLAKEFIGISSDIPGLPSGLFTELDGTVQLSGIAPDAVGSYFVEVVYEGSSGSPQSKATGTPPLSEVITVNVIEDGVGVGIARLIASEGDGQRGLINDPALPLKALYTEDDVPVAGISILWTVNGGGSPSSQTTLTNAEGIATFNYTFGGTPGPVQITASRGEVSADFMLTAELAQLAIVSGNGQRGPVQTNADQPLVVELTNGSGVPLANRAISWTLSSGDAALLGGTGTTVQTTTNASGRASVEFRYGTTPGAIAIQASSSIAASPAIFSALSELPGLRIVSGNSQSGEAGQALAEDLVVSIAPELAKALGGVSINWEVLTGGGSIANAVTTTDANGQSRNQLTLGEAPGNHQIRASIQGGPSVTFSADGLILAVELVKVSGDNQSELPTNSDSAPLVVRVRREGGGTPVAGATIVWSGNNAGFVVPGSTTLASQTTSLTNAQGEARIIARVIASGPATVSAALQDSVRDPLVFTLQGAIANTEALNENERGLAEVLDSACASVANLPNRTPAQEDLLQRCRELQASSGANPDDVSGALAELDPDVGFTMTGAGLEVITTQISNVNNYLVEARNNPAGRGQFKLALATAEGALPLTFLPSTLLAAQSAEGEELGPDFGRWGFFASGTIGRGKYRDGQRVPDYDYNTGNLTLGVDYRVSDAFILGAGVGFSRHDTDLRNGGGNLETSGWNFISYGTWYNERQWFVDGVLSIGSNDYDLTRRVNYTIRSLTGGNTVVNQIASASTKGDQLGLSLSVGRDWQRGPWSLNSYLRGNYLRTEYDAYNESMIAGLPGTGLALGVEARDLKNTSSVVGGKATYILSRDWGILMPHAQVEWEHSFSDDPSQLFSRFLADPTNTRFIQRGDDIDTDFFNVGFGMSALWPGGRSAYLTYERLVGASRLKQDTLSLGVRIEF